MVASSWKCIFHTRLIQARISVKATAQPCANQLLQQLKSPISRVDFLGDGDWQKKILPIDFTDSCWQS